MMAKKAAPPPPPPKAAAPPAPAQVAAPPVPSPHLDPQQAAPDAPALEASRPPPIVPNAPTIDELNGDGTLKDNPVLAAGNPKLRRPGQVASLRRPIVKQ